jgi:endonuclease/exonuclease/phosphatase (EEP) superfamily protein YafD
LILAAALCGVHGVRVLSLQVDAEVAGTEVHEGPALRLLLSNVHTRNQVAQPLLELIADENPDVVCLLEVDRRWLYDLHSLEVTHPHFDCHPRSDNFGIAIYSKLPFDYVQRIELGSGGKPSIHARVEHGGRPFEILVTHPVPPVGRFNAQLRDAQIIDLASLASGLGSRAVIVGDLNATPWTPVFQELLRVGSVRDSMQGHGVHATWPAGWPSWLRIPIDHVLLGMDVTIEDRRVGPYIGSDHRPVIVDFR